MLMNEPGMASNPWIRWELFRSGRTESTLTTFSLCEGRHFLQGRVEDSFANELSDAVSLGHIEVLVGMIEEDNPQVASVIFIHDTSYR